MTDLIVVLLVVFGLWVMEELFPWIRLRWKAQIELPKTLLLSIGGGECNITPSYPI